jgi:RNA polymerase sigma-70 factor (ECF subfamily)
MGETPPSDRSLLERIRAGEEEAYELLFRRHGDVLRGYAERWLPGAVRRRVSVSDVVQEAQIVAYKRLAEFEDRGEGSLRNWLLRIVELKVREAVRRHLKTAKRSAENEVTRGQRADTGQYEENGRSPSSLAAGSELREQIEAALAELPEDHRRILRLTREEHLTLAEAAARMGRTREAAKKLHGRAMVRFGEALTAIRGGGNV